MLHAGRGSRATVSSVAPAKCAVPSPPSSERSIRQMLTSRHDSSQGQLAFLKRHGLPGGRERMVLALPVRQRPAPHHSALRETRLRLLPWAFPLRYVPTSGASEPSTVSYIAHPSTQATTASARRSSPSPHSSSPSVVLRPRPHPRPPLLPRARSSCPRCRRSRRRSRARVRPPPSRPPRSRPCPRPQPRGGSRCSSSG